MKKIVYLICFLIMIFLAGCVVPIQPQGLEEEGVTYIDITDLVEESDDLEEEIETVDSSLEEEIEEVMAEVEESVIESTSAEITEVEVTKEKSVVKEIPILKVTEGDLVNFPNLKAEDPDGDKITYTFSEPLNDNGEWQTEKGDAGEYKVTITASDGTTEITQEVSIIVEAKNKVPVLENIGDIIIDEGETLKLTPKALDPEGQPLTIEYSGWMRSDTKELGYDEAGEYIVRVTVSDGVRETFQDVKVTVRDVNRAPTFVSII